MGKMAILRTELFVDAGKRMLRGCKQTRLRERRMLQSPRSRQMCALAPCSR